MESRSSAYTFAPVGRVAVVEVGAAVMEVVALDECSAVRDVGVVIIDHRVAMPVESPVVPSPAVTAKEAELEAQAKANSRSCEVQSRIRIPAGPHR